MNNNPKEEQRKLEELKKRFEDQYNDNANQIKNEDIIKNGEEYLACSEYFKQYPTSSNSNNLTDFTEKVSKFNSAAFNLNDFAKKSFRIQHSDNHNLNVKEIIELLERRIKTLSSSE